MTSGEDSWVASFCSSSSSVPSAGAAGSSSPVPKYKPYCAMTSAPSSTLSKRRSCSSSSSSSSSSASASSEEASASVVSSVSVLSSVASSSSIIASSSSKSSCKSSSSSKASSRARSLTMRRSPSLRPCFSMGSSTSKAEPSGFTNSTSSERRRTHSWLLPRGIIFKSTDTASFAGLTWISSTSPSGSSRRSFSSFCSWPRSSAVALALVLVLRTVRDSPFFWAETSGTAKGLASGFASFQSCAPTCLP
mmetsp:Transcript_24880/g.52730  ORF Transcript_24880/g.52730 Transcript_24880/m.52730 type:complete len:249 (+) Transcript_24880:911-1657(+)